MIISQTQVIVPEAVSHLHVRNNNTVSRPESGSLKVPGTEAGDPTTS